MSAPSKAVQSILGAYASPASHPAAGAPPRHANQPAASVAISTLQIGLAIANKFNHPPNPVKGTVGPLTNVSRTQPREHPVTHVEDLYTDVFHNKYSYLNHPSSYEAFKAPAVQSRSTIHKEIQEFLHGPKIAQALSGEPLPRSFCLISAKELHTLNLDPAEIYARIIHIAFRLIPEVRAKHKADSAASHRGTLIDLFNKALVVYFDAFKDRLSRAPLECYAFTFATPKDAAAGKSALEAILHTLSTNTKTHGADSGIGIKTLLLCQHLSQLHVGRKKETEDEEAQGGNRCLFTLPAKIQELLYPAVAPADRDKVWNAGLEIITLLSGKGWDSNQQNDLMKALHSTQKWQFEGVREILRQPKSSASPKTVDNPAWRLSVKGRATKLLATRQESSFHSGDPEPLKVDNNLEKTLGCFTEDNLIELTKKLLDLGVRVTELIDDEGRTILHKCRNPQVLRLLLEHLRKIGILELDRFISKCDHQGYTALHQHASQNRIQNVKVLLDFGANIDALTVLPVSKDLLAGLSVPVSNPIDPTEQGAHKKALSKDFSSASAPTLKTKPTLVLKPKGKGRTALHFAISNANMDPDFHQLARFLIREGARVDIQDRYPIIPPNMKEFTEENVKSLKYTSNTPIDRATQVLHGYSQRTLIKATDEKEKLQNRITPMELTLALMHAAEALGESDAESLNADARSPQAISLALDAPEIPIKASQKPITHAETKMLLVLKQIGMKNPVVRDRLGRNVLHHLHSPQDFRVILNALQNANLLHLVLNKRDDQDLTPLHCHVKNGDLQAVHLLLEFGADPNLPSRLQRTPLHFAIIASEYHPLFLEIAYILLSNEASFDLKDRVPGSGGRLMNFSQRQTALDYANSILKKISNPESGHKVDPHHIEALRDIVKIMENMPRLKLIVDKIMNQVTSNPKDQTSGLANMLDVLDDSNVMSLMQPSSNTSSWGGFLRGHAPPVSARPHKSPEFTARALDKEADLVSSAELDTARSTRAGRRGSTLGSLKVDKPGAQEKPKRTSPIGHALAALLHPNEKPISPPRSAVSASVPHMGHITLPPPKIAPVTALSLLGSGNPLSPLSSLQIPSSASRASTASPSPGNRVDARTPPLSAVQGQISLSALGRPAPLTLSVSLADSSLSSTRSTSATSASILPIPPRSATIIPVPNSGTALFNPRDAFDSRNGAIPPTPKAQQNYYNMVANRQALSRSRSDTSDSDAAQDAALMDEIGSMPESSVSGIVNNYVSPVLPPVASGPTPSHLTLASAASDGRSSRQSGSYQHNQLRSNSSLSPNVLSPASSGRQLSEVSQFEHKSLPGEPSDNSNASITFSVTPEPAPDANSIFSTPLSSLSLTSPTGVNPIIRAADSLPPLGSPPPLALPVLFRTPLTITVGNRTSRLVTAISSPESELDSSMPDGSPESRPLSNGVSIPQFSAASPTSVHPFQFSPNSQTAPYSSRLSVSTISHATSRATTEPRALVVELGPVIVSDPRNRGTNSVSRVSSSQNPPAQQRTIANASQDVTRSSSASTAFALTTGPVANPRNAEAGSVAVRVPGQALIPSQQHIVLLASIPAAPPQVNNRANSPRPSDLPHPRRQAAPASLQNPPGLPRALPNANVKNKKPVQSSKGCCSKKNKVVPADPRSPHANRQRWSPSS